MKIYAKWYFIASSCFLILVLLAGIAGKSPVRIELGLSAGLVS